MNIVPALLEQNYVRADPEQINTSSLSFLFLKLHK